MWINYNTLTPDGQFGLTTFFHNNQVAMNASEIAEEGLIKMVFPSYRY